MDLGYAAAIKGSGLYMIERVLVSGSVQQILPLWMVSIVQRFWSRSWFRPSRKWSNWRLGESIRCRLLRAESDQIACVLLRQKRLLVAPGISTKTTRLKPRQAQRRFLWSRRRWVRGVTKNPNHCWVVSTNNLRARRWIHFRSWTCGFELSRCDS